MKNKLIIIISVIIVLALMGSLLLLITKEDPKVNLTEDEIQFKNEYESLNGVEKGKDYVLKNISINNDNNVIYVNDNEIMDVLTNDSNIIYFGFADCNWCRTMIPILLSVLKENNIDKLYYYDFKELRTNYENDTDESKVKLYESIINIIGKDIDSTFEEGSIRAGQKKILAPTVVFIKNGEYVGMHINTVEGQKLSTDELNKNQIKELKNAYQELIDQINPNICPAEGC